MRVALNIDVLHPRPLSLVSRQMVSGQCIRRRRLPLLTLLFTSTILASFVLIVRSHSLPHQECRPVQNFKSFGGLGNILENQGGTAAVELGYRYGSVGPGLLRLWKSCRRYVMVDVRPPHERKLLGVFAKNENDLEMMFKADVVKRMSVYRERTEIERCEMARNVTCAQQYAKKGDSFDLVYFNGCELLLDAEQVDVWWGLLKPGGLIAGHNHTRTGAVLSDSHRNTNWIDYLAAKHSLKPTYSHGPSHGRVWALRKPF